MALVSDYKNACQQCNPFGPSGSNHSVGLVPDPGSSAGSTRYVCEDGTWSVPGGGGGAGTVTSVGMTVPSILSVSGSPVTTAGTLAVTLATETANTVLAGPTSGGAATPTFRSLVAADMTAGAGAGVTYTGTYAAMPAAATAGNGSVYYATDSFGSFRSTGAAWETFAPSGVKLPDPNLITMAWQNQGTATIDTTHGGISMSIPASTVNSLRVREWALPAAPYTFTAAVIFNMRTVATANGCGIGIKEAGNGKCHTAAFGNDAGLSGQRGQTVYKWTNLTTFSASYVSTQCREFGYGHIGFIRIQDDNTNRITSYSVDGVHWVVSHSVTRLDFLTPTLAFFYVNQAVAVSPPGLDGWLIGAEIV